MLCFIWKKPSVSYVTQNKSLNSYQQSLESPQWSDPILLSVSANHALVHTSPTSLDSCSCPKMLKYVHSLLSLVAMFFLHTFILLSLLPSESLCVSSTASAFLVPFFFFSCCCGNQLCVAVSWLHRESITFTPVLVFHFIKRCQQNPPQCRTVHLTDLPFPVCDGSWCLSTA